MTRMGGRRSIATHFEGERHPCELAWYTLSTSEKAPWRSRSLDSTYKYWKIIINLYNTAKYIGNDVITSFIKGDRHDRTCVVLRAGRPLSSVLPSAREPLPGARHARETSRPRTRRIRPTTHRSQSGLTAFKAGDRRWRQFSGDDGGRSLGVLGWTDAGKEPPGSGSG